MHFQQTFSNKSDSICLSATYSESHNAIWNSLTCHASQRKLISWTRVANDPFSRRVVHQFSQGFRGVLPMCSKNFLFQACLISGLCFIVPLSLFADFQYTETTKITGGSIVSMMKFAGALSKEARQATDPVISTVLVKGNRKAHISSDSSEIIDLDKETVTRIDHKKKVYSVITFQQMKQELENASREAEKHRAQQPASAEPAPKTDQPEMTFKVNVRETGASRQVAGLDAKEAIMTMALQGEDKKTGQTGALDITNDMWMTTEIPGYGEVRDFDMRWGKKMGAMLNGALNPSASMPVAMQPGAVKGMSEMTKEMAKMKGVPVLQIMRMGSTADGQPLPAASEAPLPPSDSAAMPNAAQVAQGAAANTASNAATSAVASQMGGLGGLIGGLGGFGHKKKQQQQDHPADQPSAQNAGTASVLVESSTELTSFSSASVDDSRFSVPVGYKQVDPAMAGPSPSAH
jgi:hypothetical protein